MCLHIPFPRSAPTQDTKGQSQCKDKGWFHTCVKIIYLMMIQGFAKPGWCIHKQQTMTSRNIQKSYQFISVYDFILLRSNLWNLYSLVCAVLPASLWMDTARILYLHVGEGLPPSDHLRIPMTASIGIFIGESRQNSWKRWTCRSALQPQQRWDWDLHP